MRQPQTQAALCVALILGGCALGCSAPPMAPEGVPPQLHAAPALSSNPSNALVTIDDPFAIVDHQGSRFGYAVRFLLRETGGASGATIDRVLVYGPSGSDEANVGCWQDTLRVPVNG